MIRVSKAITAINDYQKRFKWRRVKHDPTVKGTIRVWNETDSQTEQDREVAVGNVSKHTKQLVSLFLFYAGLYRYTTLELLREYPGFVGVFGSLHHAECRPEPLWAKSRWLRLVCCLEVNRREGIQAEVDCMQPFCASFTKGCFMSVNNVVFISLLSGWVHWFIAWLKVVSWGRR